MQTFAAVLVKAAVLCGLLGAVLAVAPNTEAQTGESARYVVHSSRYSAGWVIAGGERQWVPESCRTQLESAGAEFAIAPWAEIVGQPAVSTDLSCDALVEMVSAPETRGSYRFVVHNGTYTAGWAVTNGTRQWVSSSCREQLEAAGAAFTVSPWNDIVASPPTSSPATCDAIARNLGDGSHISNHTVATSDLQRLDLVELSDDGSVLVLRSRATASNSVGFHATYVYNTASRTLTHIGSAARPALSGNGTAVIFIANAEDRGVFVYDVASGTTTQVNRDSSGQIMPIRYTYPVSISSDARIVTWSESNTRWARDLSTGTTTEVAGLSAQIRPDGTGVVAIALNPSTRQLELVELSLPGGQRTVLAELPGQNLYDLPHMYLTNDTVVFEVHDQPDCNEYGGSGRRFGSCSRQEEYLYVAADSGGLEIVTSSYYEYAIPEEGAPTESSSTTTFVAQGVSSGGEPIYTVKQRGQGNPITYIGDRSFPGWTDALVANGVTVSIANNTIDVMVDSD